MSETAGFERDLARLVAACETGLDLPGVLAAAADAAGAALSAGSVSSYALSEQRDGLARLAGDGPQRLELPGLEPVTDDGRTLLPLVSAGRVLGGLLAERVAEPGGLGRARIAAGIAAQAMEASRLWDSVAGESGTLDPLTRLPNHLGFQSVLGRELARAKRTGQSLAVSLVDLDGLAGYTARHGAAEADRVLRLAAGGLAGGVRSYDCVCRLDEGEFALVLPGMTAESAAALVGRLAGGFGTWSLDGDPITVSGGVAAFPEHAATNDELVRLASAALRSRRRRPRDRLGRARGGRRRPGAIAGGARRTIGRLARRQRVRGAHRRRLRTRARSRRPGAPGGIAGRPGRRRRARRPSAGAWPSAWRPA